MYKNPAPTTNVIIFDKTGNKICLLKRNIEPHLGKLALPGGYVDYGEMIEQAAIREVKEETGLDIELSEILGVYSHPERNPSKHTISTVFIAKVIGGELTNSSEGEAFWLDVDRVTELAFDHNLILSHFRKWLENKTTSWSSKQLNI